MQMALLVVMYKTPHDAAAFDKHYFEKHIPLAKKIPGLRKYEVSRGAVATPAGPSNYRLVALLHYDDVAAIQKPSPAPKGKRPLPTYRPSRPAAPTYSCLTHARCDSPSRNQNTGAVAAPVFSYSRPPVGRGDP
jgi:uncharacterized protein (TIGR02118 family)